MNPTPLVLELPDGRARLEPLEARHVPSLFAAGQDPAVWRFIACPTPRTLDEMALFVERALAGAKTGAEVPFAIIDRSTGQPAGSTRYLDIQAQNHSLEIGFTWVGAPWQRTAINTECKYLLLRHAFESLGAVRVQLKTDARNQQSQRAILRIGAVYEGCLRRSRVLPDGFVRDTMCYSVVDNEWPAVKRRLEEMLAARG